MEQSYVDEASAGYFVEAKCENIPADILKKYFVREEKGYRVSPEIRQWIVFARHNMISDAPFTRLDLVSCRNVLIYFDNELQERVLRRFQYALSGNGLLFLGSSESVGSLQREFMPYSQTSRIFRALRPGAVSIDALDTAPHRFVTRRTPIRRNDFAVQLTESAKEKLIQEVAPPSVLLNQNNEVLHIFGDISAYATIGKGDASFDIKNLVPGRVAAAIASLTRTMNESAQPCFSAPVQIANDGDPVWIKLQMSPVSGRGEEADARLLSFLSLPQAPQQKEVVEFNAQVDFDELVDARVHALEQELEQTQENLKNTIEELEASNEELQATNEELLASNEELQSANEELQSVNEEIYTVNSEYQEKIKILDRLNSDLDTMTEATGVPTLFLNRNLEITRFTGKIESIYQLNATDIGRSIRTFSNKIGYSNLIEDAQKALQSEEIHETLWRSQNGKTIIRFVPYLDGVQDRLGLVILFLDVSAFEKLDFLQTVIDSLPEHIAVLNSDGEIRLTNQAWRDFAAQNDMPEDYADVGAPYLDVCSVDQQSVDFETANTVEENLRLMLSGKQDTFTIEYPCHSKTEERWFLMHAKKMGDGSGGIVVSHINTTAWHKNQNNSQRVSEEVQK